MLPVCWLEITEREQNKEMEMCVKLWRRKKNKTNFKESQRGNITKKSSKIRKRWCEAELSSKQRMFSICTNQRETDPLVDKVPVELSNDDDDDDDKETPPPPSELVYHCINLTRLPDEENLPGTFIWKYIKLLLRLYLTWKSAIRYERNVIRSPSDPLVSVVLRLCRLGSFFSLTWVPRSALMTAAAGLTHLLMLSRRQSQWGNLQWRWIHEQQTSQALTISHIQTTLSSSRPQRLLESVVCIMSCVSK